MRNRINILHIYIRSGGVFMNKKGQDGAITTILIAVVVVILGVIMFAVGFDQVDASHLGVMNQFGNIKGVMQPGMQWTGLFTSVYEYDLRTRPVTIQLTTADSAVTKDGQTIMATIQVNWKLKPNSTEALYRHVGPDDGNNIYNTLNIEGRIKHGFKSVTAKYNSGLDITNNRDQVIKEAIAAIHEQFPAEYAEIEYIVIPNIGFKPEYQEAIDRTKEAERLALLSEQQLAISTAEAQKAIAVAEGNKQVRIRAADADKYERIAAAEGEAEAIRLQGQAEGDALAAKRNQLTPLTVQNAWIEAWKSGGAQVPAWITSESSGQFLMNVGTPGGK
jgi:regulator of protease activity HflC (stomatin/prohibitin superfamily)